MPLPARPQKQGSSRLIHAILGLAVLTLCLHAWIAPWPQLPRAHAQLPNPADQRNQVIEELRRNNRLLSDIKRLLESGNLKVRLASADNQADEHAPNRAQP